MDYRSGNTVYHTSVYIYTNTCGSWIHVQPWFDGSLGGATAIPATVGCCMVVGNSIVVHRFGKPAMTMTIWLVVWLPFFIFPLILGMSSSQLTNIFQRGSPTTNQECTQKYTAFFLEDGILKFGNCNQNLRRIISVPKSGGHGPKATPRATVVVIISLRNHPV